MAVMNLNLNLNPKVLMNIRVAVFRGVSGDWMKQA